MTTVQWPAALKPRDFGYFFLDADQSGGVALGGGEQVVFSPGARWGAAMTLTIRNKEQLLAIRGLRGRLRGRANPIALPNWDGKRVSWPQQFTTGGNPTGVILKPNVTRNRSLDGTVYADLEIPAKSEIEAEMYADAAARDTTIVIRVTQGEDPLAGQQFGLDLDGMVVDGPRLYEISTVTNLTSPSRYSLTFSPPLRTEPKDGDAVIFTRPHCLMRCMNLNEELTKLDAMTFATLNLEFVEYL